MSARHKRFFPLFLIAALAAFFGYAKEASAQAAPFEEAAEGLTLSPPSFEMTLRPGEETAHTIQVTNPTKNLIELYPSAGNFSAAGDGGQPKYEIGKSATQNSSPFSIADWVQFDAPKIALLPEQVVEFRFRIRVPIDAEPGGHYGVVFLGTKPPEEKDPESQVALSTMVGSLLLVRIPGDIRENARIEEFSAPWFFFSPPVSFTTFLRNMGNVHLRPEGEIVITDWRGRDISRIEINPKKGSVLPESRRKFDLAWKPETEPFWKIPVGKFHATLNVVYGQTDQTLTQALSFWVIPKWLIITIGILIMIALCFGSFRLFRRKRRARNRRASSDTPRIPTPEPPARISREGEAVRERNTSRTSEPELSPFGGTAPALTFPPRKSPISRPDTIPPDWLSRIEKSTRPHGSETEKKKTLKF